MDIYLDGIINDTKTTGLPASIYDGAAVPLTIGAYNASPSVQDGGDILAIMMWDKALTPLQILDLNNRLRHQLNDI